MSTFFSAAFAQNIMLTGEVTNPITNEGVHETTIKVLNVANDSVLAVTKAKLNMIVEERDGNSTGYLDKNSGAVFNLKISSSFQDVVLIVSASGYDSVKKNIHIDSEKKRIDVGTINLLPAMKQRNLNEATVTATKIKMYYKGDTLVYNADAFNVLKNESLRKLVLQLPNTKIEEGVIYVNGKPIESLLFSGKDFFNGNIDAALDRLPAYIVSKLKVYDKQGELSELTGRDMHDKQYVMDVHLKREYLGTWMAKLGADIATEKLWGGQGFLMRMDDRQMLSIDADVNNFNEERKMVDICNMANSYPTGRHKNKVANIEYFFEPNSTWRFSSNASVQQKEQKTYTWTNTETFLTPDNLMAKNKTFVSDKDTRINAYAALRARQTKKWQSELKFDFTFDNMRNAQDALTLAFWKRGEQDWHTWEVDSIWNNVTRLSSDDMLYTLLNPTLQKQKTFTYKPEWKTSLVLGGNPFNIDLQVNHNNVQNDLYNNYKLDYLNTQDNDHRRIYNNHTEHNTTVDATIDYGYKYFKNDKYDGVFTPYVAFNHTYGNLSHPYYRLERMQEWLDALDWTKCSLGILPDGEWQAICFDNENSYYSKEKKQTGSVGMRLSHKLTGLKRGTIQFDADLGAVLQYKHLDYQRNEQSYDIDRHAYSFRPTLTMEYRSNGKHKWSPELRLNYTGKQQLPNLLNMLQIEDNADPLNLFRGNASLQGIYDHQLAFRYGMNQRESGHSTYISIQYTRTHNDIVASSIYNAENGGRIYEMVNTNRTHAANGDVGYSLPLDKNQRFYITLSVRGNYRQNADMSQLNAATEKGGLLQQYGVTPNAILRGTVGNKFRFSGRWNTTFSTIKQSSMDTLSRNEVGSRL
uniref:outer membrane beta-barrel protein n=1 Tax=Alloprevotella sp. TaxID=1872471 RepID=UPI0040294471